MRSDISCSRLQCVIIKQGNNPALMKFIVKQFN